VTVAVVDASVALKWTIPEEHSDAARRLLGSEHELVAPPLIALEIANVLLKRARRRELTMSRAATVLDRLEGWLRIVEVEEGWSAVFRLAARHHITAYDASYLALTLRLGARLVTADNRLVNALAPELPGVAIFIADVDGLDDPS
jgi:predicted nucleic acid-binding protein